MKSPKPKHIGNIDRPLSAEDYYQRQQERQKRMRDLSHRCLAGEITMEEWMFEGVEVKK